MQKIGQGAFSTVWRKNKNTVLIESRCFAKECMSFGWIPNSRMFPTLKQKGFSSKDGFRFYESKYYAPVKSLKQNLKPQEWEFYKILRNCQANEYENVLKEFMHIPNTFRHRRGILIDTLNSMTNYGLDVSFEISPRNVAVNNGRLILLDCFYFISQCKH